MAPPPVEAKARIAPRIGPTQGVQPKPKAAPIKKEALPVLYLSDNGRNSRRKIDGRYTPARKMPKLIINRPASISSPRR